MCGATMPSTYGISAARELKQRNKGMSSSDDDEVDGQDILSMIMGSPPTAKRQKLAGSSVPSATSRINGNHDLEVDIPAIFQTRGQINESINELNKQIKLKLLQGELKREREYSHVQHIKNQFLVELNDNGSRGSKVFSLNDTDLLDRFVNADKFNELDHLVRHFYFYQTPVDSDAIDSIDTSIPFAIDWSFINQLARQFSRIVPCFAQFIAHCALKVTNLNHLRKVDQFLDEVLQNSVQLPSTSCLQLVSMIGGDVDLLHKQNLPLKLYQVTSDVALCLLRLSVVLKFQLLCKDAVVRDVYKIIIYTICDFNINEHGFKELNAFVKGISPYITDQELFYDIMTNITSYNYGSETQIEVNYELQYHVLKVLCANVSDMRLFVSRYLFNEASHTAQAMPRLLKTLETDFEQPIVEQDLKCKYYKLLALTRVLQPYEDHLNHDSTANYSQDIRRKNLATLIKLKTRVDKLKANYEHAFSTTITATYNHGITTIIGNIFETVITLSNNIERDLLLINDDLFYRPPQDD